MDAATRVGTAVYSTAGGGFNFDVADPCSGLRSVLAMAALSALYGHLTQKTLLKKWLLFLGAIPVAVAGNVARIVTIALVAVAADVDRAMRVYHDFSGFIVFAVFHIYIVVYDGHLYRNGLISSMVSGYKFYEEGDIDHETWIS